MHLGGFFIKKSHRSMRSKRLRVFRIWINKS
jgi:hypothetical protein